MFVEQTIFDYAKLDLISGKYFLNYHGLIKQSVLFSHKYTAVKLDPKTHCNVRKCDRHFHTTALVVSMGPIW